jgi:hypothetical protein
MPLKAYLAAPGLQPQLSKHRLDNWLSANPSHFMLVGPSASRQGPM